MGNYWIHRIDQNQKDIIERLRSGGYSVCSIARAKDGAPDIIVGVNGKNFLFEIKNKNSEYGRKKLKPVQQNFISSWKGQVNIVYDLSEILEILKG